MTSNACLLARINSMCTFGQTSRNLNWLPNLEDRYLFWQIFIHITDFCVSVVAWSRHWPSETQVLWNIIANLCSRNNRINFDIDVFLTWKTALGDPALLPMFRLFLAGKKGPRAARLAAAAAYPPALPSPPSPPPAACAAALLAADCQSRFGQ